MAHTVSLSWTASTDTVDGYNVYRGAAAGQEITKLNSAVVVGTSFTDTTATVGESFYVARSVVGGIESVNSNEVSVSVRPAAPTNLVVSSAA
jgi:hypothetical protein